MAEITTPANAKTADDALLITAILAEWAQTNPDLSTVLERFISEVGLKSLLSDSVTTTDANKIASLTAVKLAMRQYITENYTDGAAGTPAAGSTALGRNGHVVINGDGKLTAAVRAVFTEGLIANNYIQINNGNLVVNDAGILANGDIVAFGVGHDIESQSGNLKGVGAIIGTEGVSSEGDIDAGSNKIVGGNISKLSCLFRMAGSFSVIKDFSGLVASISHVSGDTYFINVGETPSDFLVLSAFRREASGAVTVDGYVSDINAVTDGFEITFAEAASTGTELHLDINW